MKPTIFTKKRTRMLCMVLLLGMLVGAVSCSGKPDLKDGMDMPDEAILSQIKRDYYSKVYGEDATGDPEATILIDHYYGTYNGCVAVMFSGIETNDAEWDIEVAGTVFHYWHGSFIEIWKDGSIYSLEDAYEQNLLTKSDIESIAAVHQEILEQMFGS